MVGLNSFHQTSESLGKGLELTQLAILLRNKTIDIMFLQAMIAYVRNHKQLMKMLR